MKVIITIPFALAFALFCLLDNSGLFTLFLLAAAIHELGHFLTLLIFRARVHQLRFELTGASMYYDSGSIGYGAEAAAALSGPLAGAIAALIAARLGYFTFAGISLTLSLVNLIPAAPLDGGRLLYALFAKLGWPEAPLFVLHCICSLGLLVFGAYVFYNTGGNFSCLLLAAWLLFAGIKGKKGLDFA